METVVYTLGQLTDDTLRQLRGTLRDKVTTLTQALDAPAPLTSESFTVADVTGITVGSLLTVGDETIYVTNVVQPTLTVTGMRGYDDSLPSAAANGSIVVVDPPWPRSVVQQRLKDELRSWGPQVFAVNYVEVPLVNWQRGYDLSAITQPVISILKVTVPQPPYIGLPGDWTGEGVPDTEMLNPTIPYRYDPNANAVEFPSGKALILVGDWVPRAIGNIHIVYATPFDVDDDWSDGVDMVGSVGVDSRDLDIPPLGASARLLRTISVRRAMLNVQGQSREDQDVTMAAILQAAQYFEAEAKSRLSDVQQRLLSDFPYRSSNY